MVCTFFGHKDTPKDIKPLLENYIRILINNNVNYFIVGNNGSFDVMVRNILIKLCNKYTNIKYNVILAYMPLNYDKNNKFDYSDTLYPDGIEAVPKRFAISYRNKWMVNKCDYVIAYVSHSWGGAAKFVDYANKRRKIIINLYEIQKNHK